MAWQDKLSRKLTLKDGRELVTLYDAAQVLLGPPFDKVKRSDILTNAGALLLKASESGKRADCKAATDQVERVLQKWAVME